MKVISFKICPFVQRVTALLEAKGITYDIEFISLSDKPDWFLEISPNGQVPVLVTDDGTALFESDAIVEYIEEAHPPLEPGVSPEQKGCCQSNANQSPASSGVGALILPEVGAIRRGRRFSSI